MNAEPATVSAPPHKGVQLSSLGHSNSENTYRSDGTSTSRVAASMVRRLSSGIGIDHVRDDGRTINSVLYGILPSPAMVVPLVDSANTDKVAFVGKQAH